VVKKIKGQNNYCLYQNGTEVEISKSKKFLLDRKKFLQHSGGFEGEIPEFMLKRTVREKEHLDVYD